MFVNDFDFQNYSLKGLISQSGVWDYDCIWGLCKFADNTEYEGERTGEY
jgi:hypothetical protein